MPTMAMASNACMHGTAVRQAQQAQGRRCTLPRSHIEGSIQRGCTAASQTFPIRTAISSQRQSLNAARKRQVFWCSAAADAPLKVAVTGAGGKTGSLTVKRLLADSDKYSVIAVVRSEESAGKLQGLSKDAVAVVDLTSDGAAEALQQAFGGAQALVIATSGVPKMKGPPKEGKAPEFHYPSGMPEQVDWLGQKAQIDAAKQAGIKKVVLIGSMGGTDVSNRLNLLGNGQILVWKRKAEEYLIGSGLNYTIIHPGGLFDEPGGERELVLGVDDELLRKAEKEGTSRRIPRDDVAALAIAALTSPSADNRSVDAIGKELGEGTPTTDFEALFAGLSGNCKY